MAAITEHTPLSPLALPPLHQLQLPLILLLLLLLLLLLWLLLKEVQDKGQQGQQQGQQLEGGREGGRCGVCAMPLCVCVCALHAVCTCAVMREVREGPERGHKHITKHTPQNTHHTHAHTWCCAL